MSHPTADLRVVLVVASVRPDRFGSTVAAWATARIVAHGGTCLDVVDLMELDLPAGLDGGGDTERWRSRVDAADAFVVLTPEYNHGYPGYLKTAIDSVVDEWQAKPVAFVSYGGGAGGARSVEQLRQVFAELDAVTVRESVTLVRVWDMFDDGGCLGSPAGPDRAMRAMLDRLIWWGWTLRAARPPAALAEVAS
ncbi:NADPH-dependent FMN reductase [Isoptericola cucumis]|uniref:FMN reductase n=1 Tax=Isoptericola cucumis TaxID=1776856 RepID=A0ABQ2BCN2_9MICO|nr:NAD(P)H-dependent oxidoreductase [Isoptericola cucumis]GGI11710.1 FMN reductase [Isoptericola cucumis]